MAPESNRKDYDLALAKFDSVASACTSVSQSASNRRVEDGRDYYASVLFTRLCGLGLSLIFLCPGNRLALALFEHWDFPAIASLARNLIDCSVAYFYLGDTAVGQEEWECRWNIFNLHDCLRRQKMLADMGAENDDICEFADAAKELRQKLGNNSHFFNLPDGVKKECGNGQRLFLKSRSEILSDLGIDLRHFRGLYVFLSCHVHSYPLGFYRTGVKERGRGLENETDREYIKGALGIATQVMQKCAQDMIGRFSGCGDNVSAVGLESLYAVESEK